MRDARRCRCRSSSGVTLGLAQAIRDPGRGRVRDAELRVGRSATGPIRPRRGTPRRSPRGACERAAEPKAIFTAADHARRRDALAAHLRPLEAARVVMPASARRTRDHDARTRATRPTPPVFVAGFGEHLTHRGISYARDLLDHPIGVGGRARLRDGRRRAARPSISEPLDCTRSRCSPLETPASAARGKAPLRQEHDRTFRATSRSTRTAASPAAASRPRVPLARPPGRAPASGPLRRAPASSRATSPT